MVGFRILMVMAVLSVPVAAGAQGPTQGRDGLGSGSAGQASKATSTNSLPAGAINAETGPQSRPAYPSGSTAANPGAAFVTTTPKPAAGQASAPTGNLGTTTVTPDGATKTGGPPVGEAATPPK